MQRKVRYLILAVTCGILIFLTLWLGKSRKKPDDHRMLFVPEPVSGESILTQLKENVKKAKEDRIKNAVKIIFTGLIRKTERTGLSVRSRR